MRISVFLNKIFIFFILLLFSCDNYKAIDKAKSSFEKNSIFLEISIWINLSNIKMSKNAKSDLFIANGIWRTTFINFKKKELNRLIYSPDSMYAIDINKNNIDMQYKYNYPNEALLYKIYNYEHNQMKGIEKKEIMRKWYKSHRISNAEDLINNYETLHVVGSFFYSIFYIENGFWLDNTNFALIGNKIVKKDTLKTILYMKLYCDTIKEYSLLKINNTF